MKKLMFAIAAAVAGTVLADVTSANVVGYQTVHLKAQGYAMIGVPFNATGSSEGINVQDLIPDATNQLHAGQSFTAADQLWYYDQDETSGYVKLYLFDSTSTSTAVTPRKGKWLVYGSPEDEEWGANGTVSQKILKPGMGLWLIRVNPTVQDVTFSGQVVVAEEGQKSIAIRTGYNMIAGSFTADFPLNMVASGAGETDIDWLGKECYSSGSFSTSDQIWFYDQDETGGYVKTYLFNSTLTSTAVTPRKNKWLVYGSPEEEGWGGNGSVTPKKIPAGRGFWYIRSSNSTNFVLKLDQPYAL